MEVLLSQDTSQDIDYNFIHQLCKKSNLMLFEFFCNCCYILNTKGLSFEVLRLAAQIIIYLVDSVCWKEFNFWTQEGKGENNAMVKIFIDHVVGLPLKMMNNFPSISSNAAQFNLQQLKQ